MWDLIEDLLKRIVMALLVIILVCLPTMYLWNWLMPYLFGLPTINFAQAGGLLILAFLFFSA